MYARHATIASGASARCCFAVDIRSRIADVRVALADRVAFLAAASDRIAADYDDDRDRIGRPRALDALIERLPGVIDRLEADLDRVTDAATVIDRLGRLERVLEMARTLHGDLAPTFEPVNVSAEGDFRFFADLRELEPVVDELATDIRMLCENRKRRPMELPDEETWDADRWLRYLREKFRREEPIVAAVEGEGLTLEVLERGYRESREEADAFHALAEKWVEHHRPEPREEPEPPPPLDCDDDDEDPFEEDPAWQLIREFAVAALGRPCDDTPLEHYLTILAIKPGARLASSRGSAAAVRAGRLFAVECMTKPAEAARAFDRPAMAKRADEARARLLDIIESAR